MLINCPNGFPLILPDSYEVCVERHLVIDEKITKTVNHLVLFVRMCNIVVLISTGFI